MKIEGLQKLTLIDYPEKIACTVFLFGCNFRCGFCHNPELVLPEKSEDFIPEKKVLDFLDKRKKYLDGVCITGGEPLLNKDLVGFLEKVKDKNYLVKVDTNGSNPWLLKKLIDDKLVDYTAMDIKSDKENYDILTGVEVNLNNIEEAAKIISNSKLDYEFRTTVIKSYHNKEVMENIGKWLKKLNNGEKIKRFSIQNFHPRKGKMIDDKFEKVRPLEHADLEKLKKIMEKYSEKVIVRE